VAALFEGCGAMTAKTESNEKQSKFYGSENAEAARSAYDGWAEGYDAENLGNGYKVPTIGCAIIARHVDPDAGPIYDAACGTGIVGGLLELVGLQNIVGSDLSPEIFKFAEKISSYQRLYEHDLGHHLPKKTTHLRQSLVSGHLVRDTRRQNVWMSLCVLPGPAATLFSTSVPKHIQSKS
jgi:predicted TPR repeat methyltransferase